MKKYFILVPLIFLAICAKSQDYFHLSVDTIGISQTAMSPSVMTERLKKDAANYAQYAPIPRMAEMDLAFGADLTEYKKLGGYGVLYIPSLNRDSSEYPIKRVYIRRGNEIIALQKIGEVSVDITDPAIIATFGKHRVDYYYLIPYQLTCVYSELVIDWNANRKEFILAKFPSQDAVDYKIKNISEQNISIDKAFLREFLKREYNIGSY